MAERFEIQIAQAKRIAERYTNTSRTMENYSTSIQNISSCLHGSSYEGIRQILKRLAADNQVNAEKVRALEAALSSCMELYEGTEKRILDGETAKKVSVEATGGENGGNAENASEEEDIWDFLYDTLMQVIGGDFYDDGNWLGTAVSVLLGFVPVLGQVCDVRDIIANIWNLIDDGPQTSEWIALGFSLVAVIPGIGDFLKHADEGVDAAGGIIKHGDELLRPLKKYADEFNDFMDKRIWGRLDEVINSNPTIDKIRDVIGEFLNLETGFFEMKPKDYLEDLIEEMVENGVVNWVQEHIDAQPQLKNEEIGNAAMIGRFMCAA